MRITTDRPGSGFQIAFFIVAVMFLAAPADKYLGDLLAPLKAVGIPISRMMAVTLGAAILFGIAPLRRICVRLLAPALPLQRIPEVAAITLLQLVAALGAIGIGVLWDWHIGGQAWLSLDWRDSTGQWIAQATTLEGILTGVVVAGLIAPVVEELAVRGLLYRAWQREWGWIAAAIASSLFFGALHPNKISQFFGAMLLVCLYRRTGSLWSCIASHGAFNILVWYALPMLIVPSGHQTGDLVPWTMHFVCGAVAMIAIPVYMRMSRDAKAAPDHAFIPGTQPHRA